MARIFGVTYQPYTYEELAAPLREATVAHQAVELNFDTLMTDADKMRAFLKEDWLSYKDYKDYVDKLNYAAEDLAKNGLTRQNRGNLLQLKRDYNGKIQAINAGILKRESEIENFKKSPKGLSSRYIGPRPEDYSVDEYMHGNMPFNPGVDGSEIYGFAAEQAKASTSRRYQEFTEGGKWRISEMGVDPQTTAIILDALNNGTNLEDYQFIAKDNPRQYQYMQAVLNDMRSIYDNALNTYGYDRFKDLDDNGNEIPTQNSSRFNTEIISGINAGIQYKRDSEADPYALDNHKSWNDYYYYTLKQNDDLKRDILKQGILSGQIGYDPYTGNIISINDSGQNPANKLKQLEDMVSMWDVTSTNYNTKEKLESLGIKNISFENKDGKYVIPQLNDKLIEFDFGGKKMKFTNDIDFTNYYREQKYTLDALKKKFEKDNNDEGLSKIEELEDLLDSVKDVYGDNLLSDRKYNRIRESFGFGKDVKINMDDIERKLMYNTEFHPSWDDKKYSIFGKLNMQDSGNYDYSNFAKHTLSEMKSSPAFGENKTITTYSNNGNDTYTLSKNIDASEFTKQKTSTEDGGILKNVSTINITPGMLMNEKPLVEIVYDDKDGLKSVIVPAEVVGHDFMTAINEMRRNLYKNKPNVNLANPNDRIWLHEYILSNIVALNL